MTREELAKELDTQFTRPKPYAIADYVLRLIKQAELEARIDQLETWNVQWTWVHKDMLLKRLNQQLKELRG